MSVTMPVVVTILNGAELLAGLVGLTEPGFAEASDDEPAHPAIRSPIRSRPVPEHLCDIGFCPRSPAGSICRGIFA
jgi:hypothetical protein